VTPETKSALPWDAPGWIEFYETRRSTTEDIYPSEWFFLEGLLVEGISVLDIGCALGGLASVLSERLTRFEYTGVDISESMIERAKQKYPTHRFCVIEEADLSILADEKFDLVVCLGVLHLSRKWRELISAAWNRADVFLLDLRETADATVEDETISYYQMDTLPRTGGATHLPYNIINSAEALATLIELCAGATGLRHYGYLADVSTAAVTPIKMVMMNTYQIDKRIAPIHG
jgi:2-polyprenyl-3-methyl-5-hydroxy-6-metoxy-1,4-benzoquinol methylase